ncbi:MAG: metallophosphoesterase [Malacoplasma sp.]|nr:metallophosphoesterase [Malacoplasma sp.]
MKKILIISDTHGDKTFFKEIIKKENPDIKIHAGDFCIDESIIKNNFDYYVAGNNDFYGPRIVDFEIDGFKCRLMHGDQFGYSVPGYEKREEYLVEYATKNKIDILFSGHTHIESVYLKDEILIINPGSLMYPRNFNQMKSYAILYIENNKFKSTNFEDIIKYVD